MNNLAKSKPILWLKKITENKRTSLLLCLIAGAAGALPYFFEYLFIFTFVSFFILFYIVIKKRNENKSVFSSFFWYFFGFYTPIYTFLSEMYPYSRFGFNETQAVFVLICSCIAIPLLHTVVESTIMSLSKFCGNDFCLIFGLSSLWVIGEWTLSLGTLAFPWCNVAVSLTGFLPYIQTASIFGKSFITFITVFACCSFVYAVNDGKRIFALLGAAIIAINTVCGVVLYYLPYHDGEGVKVATVQGNILSNEKWDSENQGTIFDRYISMTREACENGAKLVVLPETAIPQYFSDGGYVHNALAEIANEFDADIIAGVHVYNSKLRSSYNAVIGVYSDGNLSERYDKRHLVPFGEFIPFVNTLGNLFPFIAEFNEGTSNLIEGSKPIIINTTHLKVTPLVCFDSLFPQFTRDGINNGADAIAIVTNDSWFNDSAGIYTHLRHAQLRAIETRRCVIRAANTGISAIIDANGSISAESVALKAEIVYADAYRSERATLYTLLGDITLYISFIALIAILTYKNLNRRNDNGNNQSASN